MGRLLTLFIAGSIGLGLRFWFKGEFDLDQLLLLLFFPAASVVVFFIMKKKIKNDTTYKPSTNEKYMTTHMGDRVSSGVKQLYDGRTSIGTYHRFYNKLWHRILADIMEHPGIWYLNLSFNLSNSDSVLFLLKNENKMTGNKEWEIIWNQVPIGKVHTDLSFKNATKLKESIFLEFNDQSYHYKSFGIGSKTEVTNNNLTIATGNRVKGSVYDFQVNDSHKEEKEILFMVFILFNFYHEQ
ncbi:hypothetical protein [Virgibacillus ndiopensis]|uniref:hypothetical protein n=1 Tax=Virgibacillus ndiopensis TaxID=2004408 RepID=UPI000C08A304|nr:hypothetical protein [Virgibacillus ndiopensis]